MAETVSKKTRRRGEENATDTVQHFVVVHSDNKTFPLNIGQNTANFPDQKVKEGKLSAFTDRLAWTKGDVIKYLYQGKILRATVFKVCRSTSRNPQNDSGVKQALADCSRMIDPSSGEESDQDGEMLDNMGQASPGVAEVSHREFNHQVDGSDHMGKNPRKRNRDEVEDEEQEDQEPLEEGSSIGHEAGTENQSSTTTGSRTIEADPLIMYLKRIEFKLDQVLASNRSIARKVASSGNNTDKKDSASSGDDKIFSIDDDFFSDSTIDFMWRGVNMQPQILDFLKSLKIEIGNPNLVMLAITRRFYGARNLRLYLITTFNKNDPRSRPKLEHRDTRAYELCKAVCIKVLTEIKLAKKQLDLTTAGGLTQEQINEKLVRERRLLALSDFSKIFDSGQQSGRDLKKGTGMVQPNSFYWELFDRQDSLAIGKPFEKWTIWDECCLTAKSKNKEDIEISASIVLKRVSLLEQLLQKAAEEGEGAVAALKAKYDEWGMELRQ